MTLGAFFITGVLLCSGAAVSVECARRSAGRVDATVEHQVLGLWTVHRTALTDVVRALAVQKSGGLRRGSSGGPGAQLQLTLRDGTEWESTPVAHQFIGTGPIEMAKQIQAWLEAGEPGQKGESGASTLHLRWIPWLMCALAVPLVLFSTLFAMVWVNMLRRRLGGAAA